MNKKLNLIISLAFGLQISPIFAADPNTRGNLSAKHSHAIDAARAGNYETAIAELAELRSIAPQDIKIFSDYLTVLTWANKSVEAVNESKKNNINNIAEYALASIGKAARKIADYGYALAIYESLMARNSQLIDYKIAHALVLIDNKQYKLAEAEIDTLKENSIENIDVLNAQLYLGQQTNSQIKIFDASQRMLALDSKNTAAASALTRAASQLGATSKAVELAQIYRLDAQNIQQLNSSYAASHVRWGEFEPTNPTQPYAETDKGLNLLDKACQCDWQMLDLNDVEKRSLVFDRILALRNRHRASEVIAHFDRLNKHHIEVPIYALSAVGDAYLELRQPERALAAFNAVLSKQPNHHDAQLSKVYALVELERFDEANRLANQIASEEPDYLNRRDNPIVRQNDKKFQADTTATLVLAYGDDLANSEKKFATLQKIGPNNVELKNNLATIWRWRGWLDLAEKTFLKNLSEEKNDLQAKYGLANTHLDGRDWLIAEQEIKDLNNYISPDDPSLKALNKRWELHNKRQFVADFSTSKSSGSAVGSKSNNVNGWIYSAPFSNNYRAFINTGLSHGTFPEGNGFVVNPNMGMEYRSHDWRWAAQLGAVTQDGNGGATAFNADYRASDYLMFNGGIEINSQQTPVRGQRAGVDGNLINIGATYRWSELMQVSASANAMHMSDSNKRQSLGLALDRRFYTSPHYKTNLRLSLSGSNNSLDNATYFNPKSDLAIGATLLQDWITWRRYDRSFTQRFSLSAGSYQQQNFGSAGTWSISYSHAWAFDQIFELEYGISNVSQPYDGIRENRNSIFGSVNLLF